MKGWRAWGDSNARPLVPEFGSRLLSYWFALLSVRAGAWFSLVFGACCSEIVPKPFLQFVSESSVGLSA